MFIYLISWSPCNANHNDVDDDDDGGYDGDDGGGYDGDGYDGDDGGGGDHLDLSQSDRHGDDAEPEVGQGKVEDQKIPKQQMLLFFYLRSWRNPWEKEIEDVWATNVLYVKGLWRDSIMWFFIQDKVEDQKVPERQMVFLS